MPTLDFGPDFLWGASTAAHQIEGAVTHAGRTDSIWDTFCREPGAIADGDTSRIAADHLHRMTSDVALAARLGMGAWRFSLSWSRLRPEGGQLHPEGIGFYDRLVDELLEQGMTPWATLYHWDLPQRLQDIGGWANRDVAHHFADHAAEVAERLGDRVHFWHTLDDPWASAFLGYAGGRHAPGGTSPADAVRASHHLLLAHGMATERMRAAMPTADIGLALRFTPLHPASASEADVEATRRIDGMQNRFLLHTLMTGRPPGTIRVDLHRHWPDDLVRDGDEETISVPIDSLGVNYAGAQWVSATGGNPDGHLVRGRRQLSPHVGTEDALVGPRGAVSPRMEDEFAPRGLFDMLVWLHNEWTGERGIALHVVQHGAVFDDIRRDADDNVVDLDRIGFLAQHLRALHHARTEGVDVRGYLVHPFMDGFEWDHGYGRKSGLVALDDTLRRAPKTSAIWFSEVATSSHVDPAASITPG